MNFNFLVLIYPPILFLLAFCLHVILNKSRKSSVGINSLIKLFMNIFIIGLLSLWLPLLFSNTYVFSMKNVVYYFHILLFYISIVCFYIINLPAIEADSPSLVIVMKIAKAGSVGLGKDNLFQELTDSILIKPRINDLLKEKLICLCQDKYKLTAKGKFIISIFIFYRKLLGLPKGG